MGARSPSQGCRRSLRGGQSYRGMEKTQSGSSHDHGSASGLPAGLPASPSAPWSRLRSIARTIPLSHVSPCSDSPWLPPPSDKSLWSPNYPDPTPFLTSPPFSTYSFPDRLPSSPSLRHPVTLLPGTFTPTLPLPGMSSWFIQVSTQMSPPQSGVL